MIAPSPCVENEIGDTWVLSRFMADDAGGLTPIVIGKIYRLSLLLSITVSNCLFPFAVAVSPAMLIHYSMAIRMAIGAGVLPIYSGDLTVFDKTAYRGSHEAVDYHQVDSPGCRCDCRVYDH
jgi:hypothetical protein